MNRHPMFTNFAVRACCAIARHRCVAVLQLDRLRTRAEEDGALATACLVFRDDGYSGTSVRRPGLDALRDAVASAEVEHVFITTPDRLARKYVHQVLLLEELERFGCRRGVSRPTHVCRPPRPVVAADPRGRG